MDAVLNHKYGETDWVDFVNERVKGRSTGKTYKVMWDNERHTQICSTDECVAAGYPVNGAEDTGENFDGCRDLDHTNATTQLNVGDTVEAQITSVDRKNRSIQLSIKAKDAAEARRALDRVNSDASSGTTNLGALLKAKLEQK
jgi:hypothetical protein